MLEIIRGIPNDAKIISDLGSKTFSEAFGHLFRDPNDLFTYLEKTFSVDKIKSSLQKQENVYWIAKWNKRVVGYAKLKLDSPSEFVKTEKVCQLQKIYVLEDYLSMKIGLELQETLLKEAYQLGFIKIWLAVWKGNDRAIKFYQKNGFHKAGNFVFSIGKENFSFQVMEREVDQ